MKFQIRRASYYGFPNVQPCEEAFTGKDEDVWFIEVNSLEELMSLIDNYGDIVVNTNTIIVYDD